MTVSIAKQVAGKAAADLIQSGMYVGIGTGTMADCFIESLAERCKNGLSIKCVATSLASHAKGLKLGLPMLDPNSVTSLDIIVDGADEIDSEKQMIKGGGGALLCEKILASISLEMVIVIDSSKCVEKLGAFPLPLEIVPFAYSSTLLKLNDLGYEGRLRTKKEKELFVTDMGNYIYDVKPRRLWESPKDTHIRMVQVPGVIETGFFLGMAGRVLIGKENGSVEQWGRTPGVCVPRNLRSSLS